MTFDDALALQEHDKANGTQSVASHRSRLGHAETLESQDVDFAVILPFEIAEVRLVMAFCIRRLCNQRTHYVTDLHQALVIYEAVGGRGPSAAEAARTIIEHYNKLNDLLVEKNVNGASVYDSSTFRWLRKPIVWAAALLLIVGLVAEAMSPQTYHVYLTTWEKMAYFLAPMAWGGLGAAVFIMKTLSDRVSDFAYEKNRLSGTAARVLIGAVLGLVVVLAFREHFSSLPAVCTAFVAGIGTKAVYSALETLVNAAA